MTSTPFIPYWKPLGHQPVDPYSWVFFVVARIAGRHRPVAVVSSLGDNSSEDLTLQGYPLTAACQRIVTIFADSKNHRAIRAELALAADYYLRDGYSEYRPDPVDLPELSRRHHQPEFRRRTWDRIGMHEFPFITTCLLQGVGFAAQDGFVQPVMAFPEPLGTVYRDTSAEWGMVVVDITKLDETRYGIVGFAACEMRFTPSAAAEKRLEQGFGWASVHFTFVRGELRVMDEVRPRSAMSAAEYRAKFGGNHTVWVDYNDNVGKQLARIPLIDPSALDLVWPPDPEDKDEDELLPSLASLSMGVDLNRPLPDQAITSLIQSALNLDYFQMSIFDHVHVLPNF